jgi:hypothetical protein
MELLLPFLEQDLITIFLKLQFAFIFQFFRLLLDWNFMQLMLPFIDYFWKKELL